MWDAVQRHLLRSREEAVGLGHPFVGTEHMLLALLHEEPGLFAQVETAPGPIRDAVLKRCEKGGEEIADEAQLPFSTRARRVLEIAGAQSMQCFDDQVRAEYLLVALAESEGSIAGEALEEVGVTPETLRRAFRIEELDPDLRERVRSEPTIWEREPLTRIIGAAHQVARTHSHGFVGTEHILLAVLGESDGAGVAMLDAIGADRELIREAIEERLTPSGSKVGEEQLPFTSAAKQVLVQSRNEAVGRGDQSISSGHLLLGLLAEPTGMAGEVLRDEFGLDAESVRGLF